MKQIFVIGLILFVSCKSTKTDVVNCKGPDERNCMCNMAYQPVCGCNDVTYGNACVAKCAGVKSWKKGECPVKN